MLRRLKRLTHAGKAIGPGLVTGVSDDDPSGILTYLQAGALLGFQALWTSLLTLPLMYGIQEMCGRLGYVTGKGLMRLLKDRYSRRLLYPLATLAVMVITVNIGADLLAIGVVMEHFTAVNRIFWVPLAAFGVLFALIFFSYAHFASILKWLAFSLLFYVLTVFTLEVDWQSALQATLRPQFAFSRETILIIAAIFGTTISPYLFFWQASEEVAERQEQNRGRRLKRLIVTKHELKFLERDTFLGMFVSNATMWFIIAAASQLNGQTISGFETAALALKPLLGEWAFLAFGLGIIGTGLLAIPILAGSIGYALAEIFSWREGIGRPFREAHCFYLAIIAATLLGMALALSGLDPVALLIGTAILYALITPPIIYFILLVANDPAVMGSRKNSWWSNLLGWLALGAMSIAALASLFTFF